MKRDVSVRKTVQSYKKMHRKKSFSPFSVQILIVYFFFYIKKKKNFLFIVGIGSFYSPRLYCLEPDHQFGYRYIAMTMRNVLQSC